MKKVFLTGASSGIGLAIAKSLSARGYEVWGTSRDPARLPQLPHLHPVQLDLSDPKSIEQAFAGALSEAGAFDVVIDLRSLSETPVSPFPAALRVSVEALERSELALPREPRIVLCCRTGIRAWRAARALQRQGHTRVALLAMGE